MWYFYLYLEKIDKNINNKISNMKVCNLFGVVWEVVLLYLKIKVLEEERYIVV